MMMMMTTMMMMIHSDQVVKGVGKDVIGQIKSDGSSWGCSRAIFLNNYRHFQA